jgi:hypothetical protein
MGVHLIVSDGAARIVDIEFPRARPELVERGRLNLAWDCVP